MSANPKTSKNKTSINGDKISEEIYYQDYEQVTVHFKSVHTTVIAIPIVKHKRFESSNFSSKLNDFDFKQLYQTFYGKYFLTIKYHFPFTKFDFIAILFFALHVLI